MRISKLMCSCLLLGCLFHLTAAVPASGDDQLDQMMRQLDQKKGTNVTRQSSRSAGKKQKVERYFFFWYQGRISNDHGVDVFVAPQKAEFDKDATMAFAPDALIRKAESAIKKHVADYNELQLHEYTCLSREKAMDEVNGWFDSRTAEYRRLRSEWQANTVRLVEPLTGAIKREEIIGKAPKSGRRGGAGRAY